MLCGFVCVCESDKGGVLGGRRVILGESGFWMAERVVDYVKRSLQGFEKEGRRELRSFLFRMQLGPGLEILRASFRGSFSAFDSRLRIITARDSFYCCRPFPRNRFRCHLSSLPH